MTSPNECCRNNILLVPTIPAMMTTIDNHHEGLKIKTWAKAKIEPATPPMAAEWVDTFHHTLVMAQSICTARAAISIEVMV